MAALFAALARIVADLNRLMAAVERGQRGADSDAERLACDLLLSA